MDASDTILKDIQNKLEKLNVLDRIEERLVRMENDMTSIKEEVADLENGLNSINTEVAEMKQDIEKKVDLEKLQRLESEVEELRNRSRRNNLSIYLSIYLSICLSVCLSVCLSIYLSIYLSIFMFKVLNGLNPRICLKCLHIRPLFKIMDCDLPK